MSPNTSPLVSWSRDLESPGEAGRALGSSSRSCRGRAPLLPTPEVEPSALWAEALDSFEIYLVTQGRTENGLRHEPMSAAELHRARATARPEHT